MCFYFIFLTDDIKQKFDQILFDFSYYPSPFFILPSSFASLLLSSLPPFLHTSFLLCSLPSLHPSFLSYFHPSLLDSFFQTHSSLFIDLFVYFPVALIFIFMSPFFYSLICWLNVLWYLCPWRQESAHCCVKDFDFVIYQVLYHCKSVYSYN